jgi:hypothetical protein
MGNDCNPATDLRFLGLRETAMPFDWVRSTPDIISACIRSDFSGFHTDLRLDPVSERVVDGLGIEFTHDYPNLETYNNIPVLEGWEVYIATTHEKYNRRIARFIGLMRSTLPLVILCNMSFAGVEKVREAMRDAYGRTNRVVFVSLNPEGFPSNHNTLWCASKEILPQRLHLAAKLATTTS